MILPTGSVTLVYALTWAACMALLVIWPRRLPVRSEAIIILVLALICRLLVMISAPVAGLCGGLWQRPACSPIAGFDPAAAQIILLLFDLGALAALLLLLRQRALLLRWALLYALNPVILFSFIGPVQFAALQNLFLLAALICYDRKAWALMFFSLGLTFQASILTVTVLPFFLRRDNWIYVGITGFVVLITHLLVIVINNVVAINSEAWFFRQDPFNGGIHHLIMLLTAGVQWADRLSLILLAVLLCGAYLLFYFRRSAHLPADPVFGCFFALGAMLLLAPAVHFPYLGWVVPFLVLRPALSWLLLCLSISAAFSAYESACRTGLLQITPAAELTVWLPFFIIFTREVVVALRRKNALFSPIPRNVAVIIPTRNEEDRIVACIQAAQRNAGVVQVIVVDGGSKDHTRQMAEQAGAEVILHSAPPENGGGRGGQIYAGLSAAWADVAAIVHADAILREGSMAQVLAILAKNPHILGGAIGGIFDGPGSGLRLLEWANDFRAGLLGLAFGDQVQFFRLQPVMESGLFPAIPLMEDVELSLRLGRLGCRTYLFGETLISSRRWQAGGFRNARLVLSLLSVYLWQRLWGNPDPLAMYRRYYRQDGSGN